jgi:hypothetical protein
VQLESFFMAEVSLWSNGAPAQLAPGQTATLEFLLPEIVATRFQEGDTVPAWWFDLEAGQWREEGAGTVQLSSSHPGRLAWVVQVNHFTWWNCDAPWTEKSCVDVLVVDEEGRPVSGVAVFARGLTYAGSSMTRYTQEGGHVCTEVKAGELSRVFTGWEGNDSWYSDAIVATSGNPTQCGPVGCEQVTLRAPPPIICAPGDERLCPYPGPPGTAGQGVCRVGRKQCNPDGTEWSACQGQVLPTDEDCHSPVDDDCDGAVNEDCICSPQQGEPCYSGPGGTQGIGICRGGIVACDLFGNAVCLGEQIPRWDRCWTPADEDCDGVTVDCHAVPSPWALTGFMASTRAGSTATLLPNGKVLVSGGEDSSGVFSTAEVYDPVSGTWSPTGSMAWPRTGHTATLLPNGKVLVLGGFSGLSTIAAAEVYDPASGSWSNAGGVQFSHYGHTATLLPDGKVLVVGGYIRFMDPFPPTSIPVVEVYDPAIGYTSMVGYMASPRIGHTATLLPNGKVLISGASGTEEVFDPGSGTWSAAGSMASPRFSHTATLLPNGKVLISGGSSGAGPLSGVEVYDPGSNTWSAAGSMASPRLSHAAALLPNGKVLIAGGASGVGPLSAAEVYDPALNTWSAVGAMASPRAGHRATLLPNGKVLVAGGFDPDGPSSTAEVYTP